MKKNKNKAGFTLIEMLIVLAVYAMLLLVSSEILISTYYMNNALNGMQKTQVNARFVLDTISRETKQANSVTVYHNNEADPFPKNKIIVRNKNNEEVIFWCDNCSESEDNGAVKMKVGNGAIQSLSSNEVLVKKFEINATEIAKENNEKKNQPFFKILVEIESKKNNRANVKPKIVLDTIIVLRKYENNTAAAAPYMPKLYSGVYAYNLVLKTWMKINGSVEIVGANKKGYFGSINSFNEYDASTNKSNQVYASNACRTDRGLQKAASSDGKIYIVTLEDAVSYVWYCFRVYDPATKQMAQFPCWAPNCWRGGVGIGSGFSIASADKKLYIKRVHNDNTLRVYDPASGSWIHLASDPIPWNASIKSALDKVYAVSGRNIAIFNPSNLAGARWQDITNSIAMPASVTGLVGSADKKLFFSDGNVTVLNVYDTSSLLWSQIDVPIDIEPFHNIGFSYE